MLDVNNANFSLNHNDLKATLLGLLLPRLLIATVQSLIRLFFSFGRTSEAIYDECLDSKVGTVYEAGPSCLSLKVKPRKNILGDFVL